ncbi:MAG: DNA/RNA nuclease SfsA [Brevefilum sp.]|nr:DNA/RNA nuclease SfsA [Brevefilum sp.]
MQFPPLTPATFIKRDNRFIAGVQLETGRLVSAFVPTTGRLTGALRPGCRVWLEPAENPHRKTAYTLILTELDQGGLCCVNAIMANRLFYEAVSKGQLSAFEFEQVKKEVPHGRSRFDFRLTQGDLVCWVEVKSVTYVEDKVGMFPDSPTGRGRRHLEELANLVASGKQASAVFVAQRGDAASFAPFEAVDPVFAETLRQVQRQGVAIHAYRCDVGLDKIEIADEIPVELAL